MNMTAPDMRPPAEKMALWRAAPGWRWLVIWASGLTALAIALPVAFPQGPPATATPAPIATPSAGPALTQRPSAVSAAASTAVPPQPQIVYVPKYIQVPTASTQTAAAPPATPASAPTPTQAPGHQPDTAGACDIRVPASPAALGAGTVTMVLTPGMIKANIDGAQASSHGLIDPAYANTPTVGVHLDSGLDQSGRLPPGVTARVGDRVTMQAWYRNVALPCNYIPNLVTADLGPAVQGQGAQGQGSPAGQP